MKTWSSNSNSSMFLMSLCQEWMLGLQGEEE